MDLLLKGRDLFKVGTSAPLAGRALLRDVFRTAGAPLAQELRATSRVAPVAPAFGWLAVNGGIKGLNCRRWRNMARRRVSRAMAVVITGAAIVVTALRVQPAAVGNGDRRKNREYPEEAFEQEFDL